MKFLAYLLTVAALGLALAAHTSPEVMPLWPGWLFGELAFVLTGQLWWAQLRVRAGYR